MKKHKIIPSPINGKPMKLYHRYSYIFYKDRSISYRQLYYRCKESKNTFTTTEVDEKNMEAIEEAYREIIRKGRE